MGQNLKSDMPETQGGPGIIRPLNGLRGFAAIMVLLGHLLPFDFAPTMGVMLFFLLSGFLMGRLYLDKPFNKESLTRYVFARFGRVYPLFAATILIAGAISFTAMPAPFDMQPGEILQHLALAGDGLTVWTISVEFQFYLAFIPIWFCAARVSSHGKVPRLWLGWSLAVFFVMAMAAAIYVRAEAGRIDLLRYVHLFIGGLLMSVLLRAEPGRIAARLAGWGLPIMLTVFLVIFFTLNRFYPHDLVYGDPLVTVICAVILYCAVAAPSSLVGGWLSTRPMMWLGEVSFGLYLLHRIVQMAVKQMIPDANMLQIFIPIVTLTLLASWLASRLIESPARRAIRAWGEVLLGNTSARLIDGKRR